MYVAASTLHSISRNRTVLKPAWLAGFATVLGIPAADLAALTGIDPPEPLPPDDPPADDMAKLLWACRRLTIDQIDTLRLAAKAMLVEVPADAPNEDGPRLQAERWHVVGCARAAVMRTRSARSSRWVHSTSREGGVNGRPTKSSECVQLR